MPVQTRQPVLVARDALVAILTGITRAVGYRTDLLPASIHTKYDSVLLADNSDENYPKCFVILDKGSIASLVGGRSRETVVFNLLYVTKTISSFKDAQAGVEDFLSDLRDLLLNNETLGGKVESALFTDYITDGGVCDPEGVLQANISITVRN